MRAYFSINNIIAGFIAVLVGYSSSVIFIIQAAHTAGASSAEIGSWLLALGIGMGMTSIGFSLFYKTPILIAWSTPGAALLIAGLSGYTLAEAIGAFMMSASLIFLTGITGTFSKIVQRIPSELATAILAGILLQFGINAFKSMHSTPLLGIAMFLGFLLGKKFLPRYCMLLVLSIGVLTTYFQGLFVSTSFNWHLSMLHFIYPQFSLKACLNISIPLFIVTMTSQNLPGLTILRKFDYQLNISPIISWTGFANFILAPFGAFSLNLAAITAAICMSDTADPDPKRRYFAAIYAGTFYILTGFFGVMVVTFFATVPFGFIQMLAGLALLNTIVTSLSSSFATPERQDAALITFLITASGIQLFNLDAPLLGLIGGALVLAIQNFSFEKILKYYSAWNTQRNS